MTARTSKALVVWTALNDGPNRPGRFLDDGQPDLPGGSHAVLPGGGQRDYSA
jgi:hypothetical protein